MSLNRASVRPACLPGLQCPLKIISGQKLDLKHVVISDD